MYHPLYSKTKQPHPPPIPTSLTQKTRQSLPPTAIATHRVQFLPLIAGTLGTLLAARFAPEDGESSGGGGHE